MESMHIIKIQVSVTFQHCFSKII